MVIKARECYEHILKTSIHNNQPWPLEKNIMGIKKRQEKEKE
jgi:hypothetical protein